MKKIILVFFILSLFTVVSKAQRKPHSIPKPTPKVTVSPKTEGLDLGIVIEKYVSNIEINSAGKATEVFEILRKHTTAFAINKFKVDSVEFNSDTTEIEVLEAYKITAEGKKIIIPASKIKIKPTPQTEAAPAFSSLKILEIDFNGLKLGDTTYTKAVIRDKKKNFDGKFSKVVFFPTIYEYKNAEINIKAPLGFPIKFETIGVEGGKLPDEKDHSQWQWKKINTKAEKFVVGMENLLDSSPRLAVSSFADYEELAKIYWSEAKQKSIVTPQIQKLADEITNGKTDPKAQANAIYEWVNKNIRYLSVVLERGGWVPHSADSIIKNGYGDCKDYTTLLQALLSAKRIESRHILIRSDQVSWFPKVATPETFDHVILYIPTLDLYADATAPNTRLGLISSVMRGKEALLVGEKSELIKVTEEKPEDNQFLSETELEFTGNGGIKSRSTNTYIGQPEMLFRPLFADSALLTNSETFIELLLTYYGVNGTGKILNISDSHKVGEPFNVDLEVNINDYLTFLTKGSFTLPATLNLQNMLELETFIKAQEIKSPIFTGAVVFREKFIIKLPPGVNIETLPPNIKIENVTGNFNSEYKLEENTIIYKRSLTIQKGKIQPAEYKDFQELIKPALEEYNARFFYNAKSDFLRQKALEIKNRPATGKTTTEKVLTATEVAKLETELAKNPEDYKLRLQLLDYYNYAKLTPEKLKIRTQHRKWVIKNRPETDYFEIIGWTYFTAAEDLEYQELKKEWLKALENKQDNFKARLAAIDFIESAEPILAETLLLEGEKIFRDKYEFPLQLFELYNSKSREKNISQTDKKSQLQKSIEAGERALVLLKKERSDKRDSERAELLPRLANIAIELDQTEKAGNFAKELILEFGDDATDFVFSEATHKGNIILGRIALKNNDLSKAKEYLFIAVNSALRGRYYSFYPDMLLAKELLAKGEKETILEYLKLCETFKGTDKLSLKKWQTEIKQGKTPKFEWY